eukprot:TRINITY_DN1366_c0_g2_i1.p1 TRINITY_DN1366_c0_g2~~TRINITY_DN1366_c0_g2_i1.p1  ORF type:complete len:555 (-),score=143.23 TRINITY_DN1366_c0_g2_i1:40-1704(-)
MGGAASTQPSIVLEGDRRPPQLRRERFVAAPADEVLFPPLSGQRKSCSFGSGTRGGGNRQLLELPTLLPGSPSLPVNPPYAAQQQCVIQAVTQLELCITRGRPLELSSSSSSTSSTSRSSSRSATRSRSNSLEKDGSSSSGNESKNVRGSLLTTLSHLGGSNNKRRGNARAPVEKPKVVQQLPPPVITLCPPRESILVKLLNLSVVARQFINMEAECFGFEKTNLGRVGAQPRNSGKNRLTSILPYDATRVVLHSDLDSSSGFLSDYINASYISGRRGTKAYIATQAPLPHTRTDFWRMVWEADATTIINLATDTEMAGSRYWPTKESPVFQCGNFTVTHSQTQALPEAGSVLRTFKLEYTPPPPRTPLSASPRLRRTNSSLSSGLCMLMKPATPRIVRHYHYLDWHDHGVPHGTEEVVQLVGHFSKDAARHKPIVVHCSTGVGRTGTLIAICECLQHVTAFLEDAVIDDSGSSFGSVDKVCATLLRRMDVYALVKNLRLERPKMLQTVEQYLFLHSVVQNELIRRDLIPTTLFGFLEASRYTHGMPPLPQAKV